MNAIGTVVTVGTKCFPSSAQREIRPVYRADAERVKKAGTSPRREFSNGDRSLSAAMPLTPTFRHCFVVV